MSQRWTDFFGDGRFSEYVIENIIKSFTRPADLFIDGGANEGRHTMIGLSAGARVVSIEPIPEIAATIVERARVAKLETSKLTVLTCALSHSSGVSTFSYCPSRSTLSGLHARARIRDLDVRELTVEKTTIDATCDVHRLPVPAIIKLDLEGGEYDAIRGAAKTLSSRPILIFEHGGNEGANLYGYQHEQYYSLILQHGYKLFQINGRPASIEDFIRPRHWNFIALDLNNNRHAEVLEDFDYLLVDAAQKMQTLHKVITHV